MTNAPLDQNHIPAMLACLNTDTVQGTNLVPITVDDSNGGVMISKTATISFTMEPIDPKDENYKDCMLCTGTDNLTYPAVATADGELLVDE